MRYCNKCVTPETQEGVIFGDDGICQTCKNIEIKKHDIDWVARRKLLDKLVSQYAGTGTYDCIVPFSGGKDSTYQLYFVVRELGLKPLVVRYDHWGFRPHVEENNKRTFQILGCDVLQLSVSWHTVKELMRKGIELRGDFCWHCHTGVYGYVMQLAVKLGIPLLLWGEAPWEYSSAQNPEQIMELEAKYFCNFIGLGLSGEEILAREKSGKLTERDIRPFLFPSREELAQAGVRGIFLGNYIPWETRRHVEIIKKELGWKGVLVEGVPPAWDYEKIECKWQGVRDWSKFIKRGFGRTNHLASIDIRKGIMAREQGLELVRQYDGKRPASLDIFLKEINITEEQFLEWMLRHQVAPWSFAEHKYETGPTLPDMDSW